MLNITLDNNITLDSTRLPTEILKRLKDKYRHHNPEFHKKQALGFSTWNEPRHISTFEYKDNNISFLKGGLDDILFCLNENDIRYNIIDNRQIGPQTEYGFDPSFEFRDYQKTAIKLAVEKGHGLIQGAAGSGKTEIALGIIAELGLKTVVLIHNKELLHQWRERISKRLNIPLKEIGQFGDGKKKIGKQITVVTYQTAKNNLPKLANRFGCLIADEVHHTPAKSFLNVTRSFTCKYMYGFSATIKRQDLKHFISYDLFGDVVYKIERKDLVDQGFLTDIEMHVVYTNYYFDYCNVDYFTELDNEGIIDYKNMKVTQQRKFLKENELVYKDYNQYLNNITKSTRRNSQILYWVKKELDVGSTGIIFTKRREFCKLWKRTLDELGYPCVILWGIKPTKRDKKEAKDNLKKFQSGEVRIAVGTILDEGIDLPRVDVGFISYRNSSHPGQQEQQAGRLARLFAGKDKGKLYYFYDYKISKFGNDVKEIKKRFDNVIIHGQKTQR